MILDYKLCNDETIKNVIKDACEDNYSLIYGGRYILRSGKLIIGLYSDRGNVLTEKHFDKVVKFFDEHLPDKYADNYELWTMDDFYKKVPGFMCKHTVKYKGRD